jgi:hypothetical protein
LDAGGSALKWPEISAENAMKKVAKTWLLCIPPRGSSSFCIYRKPRAEEQSRECCIRHGRQLHLAGEDYAGLTRKQAREKWAAFIVDLFQGKAVECNGEGQ